MAYLNSIFTSALPQNIITNAEISKNFPEWQPEKILEKIGIETRSICSDNQDSFDLSCQAFEEFMEISNCELIDFIIYVSNSSRKRAPGDGHLLLSKYQSYFKNNPGCLDINSGCSGYVYALGIASSLIESSSYNSILIITADNYSKYISKTDKSNLTLFGDAACISLVSKVPISPEAWLIENFKSGSYGQGYNDLNISFEGNSCKLYMNGQNVFRFTATEVINFIRNQDIDLHTKKIIFHQANKFMLNYMKEKLQIKDQDFLVDIIHTGNTVSSSIPLVIQKEIKNIIGKELFLCGFGIGASYSSVCLEPMKQSI